MNFFFFFKMKDKFIQPKLNEKCHVGKIWDKTVTSIFQIGKAYVPFQINIIWSVEYLSRLKHQPLLAIILTIKQAPHLD